MRTTLQILAGAFLVVQALIPQTAHSHMFWNYACRFQGLSSSYVAVPNSTSINLTGSFSMEFWIFPQSISGNQTIISKGSGANVNRFGMQQVSGRIQILTDNTTRALSGTIVPNKWTHIAGTYNSTTHQFRIYINGVLDTSRTDIGAQPNSTTDSLFIGSLPGSLPFLGKLDEIRLWNRALSDAEVGKYFRTSLYASGGNYNGLVMSMPFQDVASSNGFSTKDLSGNSNNGVVKNVFGFDLNLNPGHTITPNEAVEFDGSGDYLAAPDNTAINPNFALALECWVYIRSSTACTFISKGNDYRLAYSGAAVTFSINGTNFDTGVPLPMNQWVHLALSYSGSSGVYNFYTNGDLSSSATISMGNPANGTDSLYIGGGPTLTDLNGFMDEVRIYPVSRNFVDLNKFLYLSIDFTNEPVAGVFYNLDGGTLTSSFNGPRLFFRNNASFTHPGCVANQPVSPINRNDPEFMSGFYMSSTRKRIPSVGTTGSNIEKTVINANLNITDVNLFVALNHSNSQNLDIVLVGPNGDSVKVMNNKSANSLDNSVVTIFDDNADSLMIDDRYSSFSQEIRPENSLNSVFNGDNAQGEWRLIVRDEITNDTGFLYAWGIQINNMENREKDLGISALIQGFYNPATNSLTPDTLTVAIRQASPPYTTLTTKKTQLSSEGVGLFSFSTPLNASSYYMELRHRNSIETWSNLFSFVRDEAAYTFIFLANTAFGSNQIQIDNSPVRFAIYNGDVNKDGSVDLSDIIGVFNDANNFLTGYVNTDVNGDNFVDLSDLTLTFNNSNNFVSKIVP